MKCRLMGIKKHTRECTIVRPRQCLGMRPFEEAIQIRGDLNTRCFFRADGANGAEGNEEQLDAWARDGKEQVVAEYNTQNI